MLSEIFTQNKNVTPDPKVDFAKRPSKRPPHVIMLFLESSVFSQTLIRCACAAFQNLEQPTFQKAKQQPKSSKQELQKNH